MNTRKTIAAASAAALAVGGITLLSTTSASADEPISFDDARDQVVGEVDPEILEAMERDFELSTDRVYDRLAVERMAEDIAPAAEAEFGENFGGSWVNDDASAVVVAVTDEGLAGAVEDLGAVAEVVDNSLADLADGVAALDEHGAENGVPDGVHSWRPGIADNTVTVVAESQEAAEGFAAEAGVDDVLAEVSADAPETFEDIVGGEGYEIDNQAGCSVGFSATHPDHGDGFLTAGHCDFGSGDITGGTGEGGQFEYSEFPGADWAWVNAGDGWEVSPQVADEVVNDGDEAEIGASVCRAGNTTGYWHCGEIVDKDVTVDYPEGSVMGMTETTVCAEPGDSGGAYVTDGSAQGLTSGGSGDCTSGGVTFFEPLERALSETGTELTVS